MRATFPILYHVTRLNFKKQLDRLKRWRQSQICSSNKIRTSLVIKIFHVIAQSYLIGGIEKFKSSSMSFYGPMTIRLYELRLIIHAVLKTQKSFHNTSYLRSSRICAAASKTYKTLLHCANTMFF